MLQTVILVSAKKFVAMPTLVWRRRPKRGTSVAGGPSSTRRDAAVPDPVVSAATVPGPAASSGQGVAPTADLSMQHKDGKMKKKRKISRAKSAAAGKKKSKATFERKLPRGVQKRSSGKFRSSTSWGGKRNRYIGTFDTPEQASIAYVSVRKDLDDAKRLAFGADEVDAVFDKARKKAVEAAGGFERDLPKGVHKLRTGKFQARKKLGGKLRYIGTFDTPEQASAACVSVKKDLEDVKLSAIGADEVNAIYDAAKTKALEIVGFVPKKKPAGRKRKLPRGVQEACSGKFGSWTWCSDKKRCIGLFDTPEQASAAYESVRNDLDDAKLSKVGADEINIAFNAAQKKALEAVGGTFPKKIKSSSERDLPRGVQKIAGKYQSKIRWAGKLRHIGSFDTPEQASAAYLSVKKDRDDTNLVAIGADEVDALFDAAKTKALETVGTQHTLGMADDKRER